MRVPFNKPFATGNEFRYIEEAIASGQLAGDGKFTQSCQKWLQETTGCKKALLTHSCTAALEMAALLSGVEPGDEVIMPSYTFVSTANAFVLRGAVPVFVDVRPDTLNIDETRVDEAVTSRTRAICAVHYAGVGCEMDVLQEVASRRRLLLVEDAAQGAMASWRGRPLGAIGALGAMSFHETKNVISGEGGALLISDPAYEERAEILWQKGTNRNAFFRGEVDKYSWVDLGSSFLPGEITAAFLFAQIERAKEITADRMASWQGYHLRLAAAESAGLLRRPVIPAWCVHNAHMYYVLAPSPEARTRVLAKLKSAGIYGVFHYVPLHSSPAGKKFGRASQAMDVTDSISERIVRLPLWVGIGASVLDEIAEIVVSSLS